MVVPSRQNRRCPDMRFFHVRSQITYAVSLAWFPKRLQLFEIALCRLKASRGSQGLRSDVGWRVGVSPVWRMRSCGARHFRPRTARKTRTKNIRMTKDESEAAKRITAQRKSTPTRFTNCRWCDAEAKSHKRQILGFGFGGLVPSRQNRQRPDTRFSHVRSQIPYAGSLAWFPKRLELLEIAHCRLKRSRGSQGMRSDVGCVAKGG